MTFSISSAASFAHSTKYNAADGRACTEKTLTKDPVNKLNDPDLLITTGLASD